MASTARPFIKAIQTLVVVAGGLGIAACWLAFEVRQARRTAFEQMSQVTAPETGYPFPAPSEISAMTIAYEEYDEKQKSIPQFDVPMHCWEEILQALSPSQYDPRPCKWKVLGKMVIELKQGGQHEVGLYHVGTSPFNDMEAIGAFSAGPDFDSRKYYRGGYTTKLEAAIKRAYSECEKLAKPGTAVQ